MKQYVVSSSPPARVPDSHPRASRQASLSDLLRRQAPPPAQRSALLPIQRDGGDEQAEKKEEKKLQLSDMGALFTSLPPEYQSHYRSQSFISGKESDRTDETLWATLRRVAREQLKREGKTATSLSIDQKIEAMNLKEACEALVAEADELAGAALATEADEKIQPFMPLGKLISFDAPGLGKGVIEVLCGESKKDTLLFAAHGFQKGAGLTARLPEVKRAFAFMSKAGVSVTRTTASTAMYQTLYKEMQARLRDFILPNAPDLAVIPHRSYDVLNKEGGLLASVAAEMDIAIFREWEWDEGPQARPFVISYMNTVPFDLLLKYNPLKEYDKFLMQVCRADWTKDAGVAGGGVRSEPTLNTW